MSFNLRCRAGPARTLNRGGPEARRGAWSSRNLVVKVAWLDELLGSSMRVLDGRGEADAAGVGGDALGDGDVILFRPRPFCGCNRRRGEIGIELEREAGEVETDLEIVYAVGEDVVVQERAPPSQVFECWLGCGAASGVDRAREAGERGDGFGGVGRVEWRFSSSWRWRDLFRVHPATTTSSALSSFR